MGDFVRFIEFLYNFLHFYRVSNPLKLNLSLNFPSFLQTHWESIKYAELYPLSRFNIPFSYFQVYELPPKDVASYRSKM